MPSVFKKVIATLSSLFVLFLAYYGSFLPLRKSQLFIKTMRSVGGTASLGELKRQFSIPLDAPSPIGQEELVRNTTNFVTTAFQQPNIKVEVVLDILQYIEDYYRPIIESGKGGSYTQNLYILGVLNELTFTKTGDPKYLEAAASYFGRGLEASPNRPQFLFGMFDVYHLKGDLEGMKKISVQISSLWPKGIRTNQAIQSVVENFKPPIPSKP